MTIQRRRGLPAIFYPTIESVDSRGNVHKIVDENTSLTAKAWIYPQRSAKAEVPGQTSINIIRIGCNVDLPGVDLWSRVRYLDKDWDVVTPPAYHRGTRHTRHWSIDLRERP